MAEQDKFGQMFEAADAAAKRGDKARAFQIYKEGAEMGDPAMQFNCGLCYLKGDGTEEDHEKALNWFAEAADQKESKAKAVASAAYMAGAMMYKGDGYEKDLEKALNYFLIAASRGHDKAQYWLGMMYMKGEGTDCNRQHAVLAIYWLSMAKRQGHENAKKAVDYYVKLLQEKYPGHLSSDEYFYAGEQIYEVKHYSEALAHYQRAAEMGHRRAQYYCGEMYRNGEGTEKDLAKALSWYLKAAEQGDKDSQYQCGNMYMHGEGVSADPIKASYWFEKAAEQGSEIPPKVEAPAKKDRYIHFLEKLEPGEVSVLIETAKLYAEAHQSLSDSEKDQLIFLLDRIKDRIGTEAAIQSNKRRNDVDALNQAVRFHLRLLERDKSPKGQEEIKRIKELIDEGATLYDIYDALTYESMKTFEDQLQILLPSDFIDKFKNRAAQRTINSKTFTVK